MPTGYTNKIKDGMTFNEFVMGCARAFGACIDMRDESANAQIPERFEPSNYHKLKLDEATSKLARLEALDDIEVAVMAQKEFEAAIIANDNYIATQIALQEKYESMLSRVRDWVPPTPDHKKLKEFMIEQIETSIKYDCNAGLYERNKPKQKTIKQWRDEQLAMAKRDIDYHTKEYKKEIEHTESRNNWLKELRNSLKDHD